MINYVCITKITRTDHTNTSRNRHNICIAVNVILILDSRTSYPVPKDDFRIHGSEMATESNCRNIQFHQPLFLCPPFGLPPPPRNTHHLALASFRGNWYSLGDRNSHNTFYQYRYLVVLCFHSRLPFPFNRVLVCEIIIKQFTFRKYRW